jgi:excinuclease ABC subunit B
VTELPEDRLFHVTTAISPSGDQPTAIAEVVERFERGERTVVLAGATGTGKSATTAWVIERMNRPALVLAPNKVLAAQLAAELKELLPGAFVGFFVSHFAYYRPEAYMPATDTFIEKDSAVDDEVERLRQEATLGLLTRKDAVVVASVSAIYGLGRPEEYAKRMLKVAVGDIVDRDHVLRALIGMEYQRNDMVLSRSKIRVRGDVMDVVPASGQQAYRIEWFGDEVERIAVVDIDSGTITSTPDEVWLPPATHHVFDPDLLPAVLADIREELATRSAALEAAGRLLEAQRLRQRTEADLESLETTGFCKGIENYSRHFDRRAAGAPPSCLVDFLGDDFLLVVDESHVTAPQIGAMFEGDQSRKRVLVEHGFRLPSALDNRPLAAHEFWPKAPRVLALSATPGPWEHEQAPDGFVDQVIRPTGLVDPQVTIAPQEGRLVDLLRRIRDHKARGNRTLVTTLTKRQAENLAEYLAGESLRVKYLHSDVSTVERIAVLRSLRTGSLDAVVGVNLLREGLDLPEVGLVAVLDADARGFLRSATSLVQTIGRAARNPEGEVVLYADEVSPAMRAAIDETDRRRAVQEAFNHANGVVPTRLAKALVDVLGPRPEDTARPEASDNPLGLLAELTAALESARQQMADASLALRFEDAAAWRDEAASLAREIKELTAAADDAGVALL